MKGKGEMLTPTEEIDIEIQYKNVIDCYCCALKNSETEDFSE